MKEANSEPDKGGGVDNLAFKEEESGRKLSSPKEYSAE